MKFDRAPNGEHAYYRTEAGDTELVTDAKVERLRVLLAQDDADMRVPVQEDIDADTASSIVATYDRWRERVLERARVAVVDAVRSVPVSMRAGLVASISALTLDRQ